MDARLLHNVLMLLKRRDALNVLHLRRLLLRYFRKVLFMMDSLLLHVLYAFHGYGRLSRHVLMARRILL